MRKKKRNEKRERQGERERNGESVRVFKSVGLCISVGRFLLPKCVHVFSLNMSRCASGSVCVFTDECYEAAVGTLCRPAIISFFPNASRKVKVIACLCRTFPRLDVKDIKMCHF